MKLIDNCTVVIRSVGERTTDLCKFIIEKQVLRKNIFIIEETPFSKAVRKTFEIGLNNNLPWTVAVDADVLLHSKGLQTLINCAESYQQPFFKGNCKGVDKFFGSTRTICPHIYTTSYFDYAILAFPEEETLRPESHVLDIVNEKFQLSVAFFPNIIALHDFGQDYEDIFRKTTIYAKKHLRKIDYFIKYWGSNLNSDYDYIVALTGLFKGLFNHDSVTIDALENISLVDGISILENIQKKQAVSPQEFNGIMKKIDRVIISSLILSLISKRLLRNMIAKIRLIA